MSENETKETKQGDEKMKIVYVGLRNIMGIKELEFAPGQVTVVEGKNGLGKTSVLKGLQDAIGGGHNATLLANGEEKGEIVLVFDDGMKLEKKIKKGASKVTLKDSKGKDIPRAASFLKEIVDDIGVNPIKILTANPKDRVKKLLDSVPMVVPWDDLERATNKSFDHADTRHPMQVIDEIRAGYYGDRTDNNRYLKEKQGQINQMRETLPFKGEDKDYDAELVKATSQQAAAEEGLKKEVDALDVWINGQKEELQSKKEAALEDIHADFNMLMEDVRTEYSKKLKESSEKLHPKINQLSAEIGELKTLKDEEVRVAGSIQYVKDGDEEIRKIEDETETMTFIINELDTIKADLLKNLPIEGMEIKDGEIYLDGVSFDNVNKAKRIRFALTIAGLRDSQLPIVCVDNLEALDEESFALFQKEAAKTGMQFFVTRVSDDFELTVNTEDE